MAHTATLALFKKHIRLDGYDGDDDYLYHLLDSAEEAVYNATHRSKSELEEMGNGQMPHSIIQAVFMLAGHWYNQRESVSLGQMHEVPDSVRSLIYPYVKLV